MDAVTSAPEPVNEPVRTYAPGSAERDQRYDQQAGLYPGFAEYAEKTAGIRTIPVLELTRA